MKDLNIIITKDWHFPIVQDWEKWRVFLWKIFSVKKVINEGKPNEFSKLNLLLAIDKPAKEDWLIQKPDYYELKDITEQYEDNEWTMKNSIIGFSITKYDSTAKAEITVWTINLPKKTEENQQVLDMDE
jgi:hypothetical protein